jgi:hypothetical protein
MQDQHDIDKRRTCKHLTSLLHKLIQTYETTQACPLYGSSLLSGSSRCAAVASPVPASDHRRSLWIISLYHSEHPGRISWDARGISCAVEHPMLNAKNTVYVCTLGDNVTISTETRLGCVIDDGVLNFEYAISYYLVLAKHQLQHLSLEPVGLRASSCPGRLCNAQDGSLYLICDRLEALGHILS